MEEGHEDGFNHERSVGCTPRRQTPAEQEELRRKWIRDQNKALTVIHLYCEREQKLIILEADTGTDAWELLADKYVSTDVVNILKVEEAFSKARKCPDQSIGSWVVYMKSLASQLKEMGKEVAQDRIAQRILNGVGKDY